MDSKADPRYVAHARKLYPGRDLDGRHVLQAAAKDAEKLLGSQSFGVLLGILAAEHETVESGLRSEAEKSAAQYARGHGVLDGLEAPAKALEALIAYAKSSAEKAETDAQSPVRS